VFEQAREVAEEAHRSFARLIARKAHFTKFFTSFWQAVAFSANAGISRLKRSKGTAELLITQLIRAQSMQCCVQYSGLS
jgi:hypothetical protein